MENGGDLNADGFADLVVGNPSRANPEIVEGNDGDGVSGLVVGAPSGDDEGEAFIFRGRGTWSETVELADVAFPNPMSTTAGRFAAVVLGHGPD